MPWSGQLPLQQVREPLLHNLLLHVDIGDGIYIPKEVSTYQGLTPQLLSPEEKEALTPARPSTSLGTETR